MDCVQNNPTLIPMSPTATLMGSSSLPCYASISSPMVYSPPEMHQKVYSPPEMHQKVYSPPEMHQNDQNGSCSIKADNNCVGDGMFPCSELSSLLDLDYPSIHMSSAGIKWDFDFVLVSAYPGYKVALKITLE